VNAPRLLVRALLASALTLGACSAAPPPGPPVASGAAPLAPLLAVAACPEVLGRVLTLSTGNDGIDDAFALVEHCVARPVDGDVVLSGDAWVWVAVDRDLGAVRVRQFVHASLHAELRLGVRASYVADHLEVALAPRPGAVVSIEPVGALEVSPLNWASLLAVELAPATGTSVEWVAKRRLREETEQAIAVAIARPLAFAYDARLGETWVVGTPRGARTATPAVPRLRVVPRGTALLGPYPESEAPPKIELRLAPGARVAARAVCRSHAERLLEADRRGALVGVEDWTIRTGDGPLTLPAIPCPWMLALRAVDDPGAIVGVDVTTPHGDATAAERGHRWIALDAVAFDGDLPVDLQLVVSTDVFRRFVVPPAKQRLPALFELSGGEALWVRAVRPGSDAAAPVIVARARIPLDAPRDVDALVDLDGDTGRLGRVHVKARVKEAP
jgi:hypothetical protein